MKTPPGAPRSRSLTRFAMRVGLPHLGQSVLLVVSITFLRSAVLAILAIGSLSCLVVDLFYITGALGIWHLAFGLKGQCAHFRTTLWLNAKCQVLTAPSKKS